MRPSVATPIVDINKTLTALLRPSCAHPRSNARLSLSRNQQIAERHARKSVAILSHLEPKPEAGSQRESLKPGAQDLLKVGDTCRGT